MPNFTFIMEFRGGTYCSQVEAKNVFLSISEWVTYLKSNLTRIKYMGDKTVCEIAKQKNENPVLLDGLKNVWCICFSTRKGFVLVNIVQTV